MKTTFAVLCLFSAIVCWLSGIYKVATREIEPGVLFGVLMISLVSVLGYWGYLHLSK